MQLPLTSYQRKFDSFLWNVVPPVTEVYHVFTDMDAIKTNAQKINELSAPTKKSKVKSQLHGVGSERRISST